MGSNDTSSSSNVLSAAAQQEKYDAALNSIYNNSGTATSAMPTYTSASYVDPTYTDAGAYQGLSGGDYAALEKALYDSATSGLDTQQADDQKALDESMASRGIYSSGLAIEANNDLAAQYADVYSQAAADAAAERYALESTDTANANTYNSTQAQNENSFNLSSADNKNTWNQTESTNAYNAGWKPSEYLAGLWTGNGGTVSSTTGGGWSI